MQSRPSNIEPGTPLIDIATRDVICLGPQQHTGEAARIMAEKRISSLVITNADKHPVGIITESNMLRAMQLGHSLNTPLQDVMTAPVITVDQSTTCLDAYRMCLRSGIRHLVIVDKSKRLLGIVSETDFRLHLNLTALAGRRKVISIAKGSAIALPPAANLVQALELMQAQHKSCVVVIEDKKPVGIVTERDVVRLYSSAKAYAQATLAEVMVSPVLTISQGSSTSQAAETMLDCRVRHLVVVDDDGNLVGLLSEHDMAQAMFGGFPEERGGIEESFLRTLVNTIPDLVWLKDASGVYLACNARFERFFGARAKDIIGKSDYDFLSREQADFFRKHDLEAIKSDKPKINEEWITYADDGHRELLETVKTPMRDRNGKLIGVLGIARDITARRQLEESLKESEIKFHDIFESVTDSIELVSMDGRIVDINRVGHERQGYAKEEMLGRALTDFRVPEQAAKIADRIADIQNTGHATFESVLLHKNGTRIPIEVSTKLTELDGQPIFLGISRDISEHKRTEDALRFIAQRGGINNAESILSELAQYLGQTLEVDYVVIDKLLDDARTAETVALYAKGEIAPNIRYALEGTPCNNVIGKALCCYEHDVQSLFPGDALLADMGVQSYAGIPLWDSAGNAIGLIAVMNRKPFADRLAVTSLLQLMAARAASELERERSDRLLRLREKEFHTLAENAPENIIRFDLDCRVVYVNPRMLQALGLSAPMMLGKTLAENFADGSADGFETTLRQVISRGTETSFEVALPASGSPPGYHSIHIVPERNHNGEVTGALAMGSDITERKQAELALRHSLEFTESVINAIPDLLFELDARGMYLNIWAHDPAMLAAQKELLLGRTVNEMLPEAVARIVMDAIHEAGEQGYSKGQIICLDLPQGKRWFELSTARKEVAGDTVKHFIMLSRDVTERMEAVSKLRANEEKLRGLYELSPMGIALTDMQGRYVEFNDAFQRICGYTRDELNRLDYWALTPKEYADKEAEQLESLSTKGYYGPYEKEYIRKDGSRIPLRLNGVLIHNGDGEAFIWSIVEDITERKRMELRVTESEKLFRTVFNAAPSAVELIDVETLRFVEANPAACEMLGYTHEEYLQLRLLDTQADLNETALIASVRELEISGGATFENRHRCKNGKILNVEVTARPLDIPGKRLLVGVWRNITESKLAEIKLRESETKYRELFETAGDGIFIQSSNGFIDCNEKGASMYGLTKAELINRHPSELAPEKQPNGQRSADFAGEKIAAVMSGHPQQFEWQALRADGTLLDVEINLSRIELKEQICLQAVVRDISVRKLAEAQKESLLSLLNATLESSTDAILVVDLDGKWELYNRHFIELWQINEEICSSGNDKAALAFVLSQLETPGAFLNKVHELYATPEANSFDIINFKDGRVIERDSIPQYIDGKVVGRVWSFRDITERTRAEENLRITASVFDTTQDAIVITNAENIIIDVNAAFSRITGYSREEVLGKNPKLLSSGRQSTDFYISMWTALKKDKAWRGEIWNRRKSGEVYAELLSISEISDAQGRVQRHVGVFSDISYLKEHEAELSRIANYDALTGIPNRRLLADRLRQAVVHAQRNNNMLAICYIDLDGFKDVNDRLGHEAGDQLLVGVTRRMQEILRAGDTLARLGGDEFVVLFSDLSKNNESLQVLERILQSISAPMQINKHTVVVSASIGVTFYPSDNEDGDTLLRHADQAMYVAKQSGKNRYHLFDPAHDLQVRSMHESRRRILQGLMNREFELYYQPKVELATGKVMGVEALIRWCHPEQGLLLPAEFLPYIEDSELEIKLGEWVIETALSQLAAWQQQGLVLEISVNISAHHLQSPNFVIHLAQSLERYPDTPRDKLQIEVLETAALEDIPQSAETIEACRKLGVSFALDDFGTGYSSLAYLRKLSAETLKIDQSFVQGMLTNEGDRAIVQGIIALAKTFGRKTVAEGMEAAELTQTLIEVGCVYGQGFGIAHPMPAKDFLKWHKERK